MNRFVRSSKYRHVFGSAAKLEDCYCNLKVSKNPWDSPYIAVNTEYIAVCWNTSGGGAAGVIPLSSTGKLSNVALCNEHTRPVLDVSFSPFNNRLFATASEDSTVKIWLIPPDGPKEDMSKAAQTLQGHGRKVGTVTFNPVAENVLATAAIDFKVKVWDIEKGEDILTCQEGHSGNIQSVEWNWNGSKYCTFCKDKMLRIIDPRSNSITGEVLAHEGIKGGRAIWLGEKDWIFSAGFSKQSERKVTIWDPKNLSKPLVEQTVDNAAGVIMPIYDNSSSIVFTAGRGDCSIRYYEVVNDSTILYFLSSYSSSTPQHGVAAMPKVGLDVSNNEIMRLYKATPTTVEPVSFRVPRRSDSFQSDLFPDAPGTKPALTAEEWFSNKNSAPILQSFEPSNSSQRHQVTPEHEFKPVVKETKKLSKAALQAQNQQLCSRISFLEAELVKKEAIIKQLKE